MQSRVVNDALSDNLRQMYHPGVLDCLKMIRDDLRQHTGETEEQMKDEIWDAIKYANSYEGRKMWERYKREMKMDGEVVTLKWGNDKTDS